MWVTENSVIHEDRSEKSVIHIDGAARPTWITEFSSIHMLCSCVTLGFFLTVPCIHNSWMATSRLYKVALCFTVCIIIAELDAKSLYFSASSLPI
jgi:hypothetical protein